MDIKKVESLLPGSRRQFKANSPLIYQGEAPRSGFFIRRGIVKTYTLQDNGEEQITGFLGPGDMFPLPWLYSESSISMYYYETTEDTQVISLTRNDISEVIQNNPELLAMLNRKLVLEQAAQMIRVTALEQPRAAEKIIYTFYYLLFRFGKQSKKNPDSYIINFKITHHIIASLIGLTRETAAVEINKLKKRGILTYENKIYDINRKKLEEIMGEDSFSELLKS